MYTIYVDESGESGIKKIRTDDSQGASPYMTLGGVLVRDNDKVRLSKKLADILKRMGKKRLHCQRLNHRQKVFFAREMAKEDIKCFGVISRKDTLGHYKTKISNESDLYYNKCCQYLLERVGAFVKETEIPREQLTICFEDGGYNYKKLRNLLWACQDKPIHINTRLLRYIEVSNIVAVPKSDEPLLQMADLVAHSLFKCTDKSESQYNIPETRYLNELQGRFFCEQKSKQILNHGLKAVHSLSQLKLDHDVAHFIHGLRGCTGEGQFGK